MQKRALNRQIMISIERNEQIRVRYMRPHDRTARRRRVPRSDISVLHEHALLSDNTWKSIIPMLLARFLSVTVEVVSIHLFCQWLDGVSGAGCARRGACSKWLAGASNSSLRAYATPASQAETYATFAESGMFGDHALIVKPPFKRTPQILGRNVQIQCSPKRDKSIKPCLPGPMSILGNGMVSPQGPGRMPARERSFDLGLTMPVTSRTSPSSCIYIDAQPFS